MKKDLAAAGIEPAISQLWGSRVDHYATVFILNQHILGQDNKWACRGNDVHGDYGLDDDVDDVDDADIDVDEQRKEFHLENNLVFAILYSLAHSQESPEMTTG